MKVILAPVDFSETEERVVREAAVIAKQFDAELRLLHVAAPQADFVGCEIGPQPSSDAQPDTLREEHSALGRWRDGLIAEGVRCRAFLLAGRAVELILEQATEHSADMIVLGSHGRTAMYKTLVGSVAEAILRDAACPVLVIPPKLVG